MHPILQGIQIGLVLTILVGPILFTLVQTGVERGIRAGLMVGLGIWVSDALYLAGVYFGLKTIQRITDWPGFELTLGLGGGILLIAIGIGTMIKQQPPLEVTLTQKTLPKDYGLLWLKGFLINTINPFTVFFWMGLMGATVLEQKMTSSEALLLFGGILGTIMVTDSLKVILAKLIRQWLTPEHFVWVRRISGMILIAFGIGLMIRVLL